MVERSESMSRKLRERLSLLAMLRRPRVTPDGATLCGVRRVCPLAGRGTMSVEATYFTTSDSQFFAGTVAMINSLRLTGNRGKVIVFDLGLSDYQRERLSTIATVESPAAAPHAFPKALPAPDRATGTIVLIDSDMLVVASLRDSLEAAGQGKIVVFPDPDDRWFEDGAQRSPCRHRSDAGGTQTPASSHCPSSTGRGF